MSERRRLAERPRKVKYTRASPELAISATRPRRVRCVVYSVQCQVCRLGVSLVVFVAWCVSSQCSVSVSSHHRLPATHHRSSYRPVLPLALGLAGSHIYLWRFRLTMFFLLQPVFFFRLRDVRCFSSCGQCCNRRETVRNNSVSCMHNSTSAGHGDAQGRSTRAVGFQ